MNKKLMCLSFVGLLALTGCSSLKQVEYAEFHEKALEAMKARPEMLTVKAKGYQKEEDTKETFDVYVDIKDSSNNKGDATYIAEVVMLVALISADTIDESDNIKYYVGGGFKATDDVSTIKMNQYGNITSYFTLINKAETKINFSYTYKK